MSLRALRLGALLLASALLLHEGVYAAAGGGERASHGYLELAIPALVALAASLILASLLLPLLGAARGAPAAPAAPLALATALVALFGVQEATEALLLGGGASELLRALTSAWLLTPLALLLGALITAAVLWLGHAERALCELLGPTRRRARRPARRAGRGAAEIPVRTAIAPMAFGIARRPPPTTC